MAPISFKQFAAAVDKGVLKANATLARLSDRHWLNDLGVESMATPCVAQALYDARRASPNRCVFLEVSMTALRERFQGTPRRGRPYRVIAGRQRFDVVYAESKTINGNTHYKPRVAIEIKRARADLGFFEDVRKLYAVCNDYGVGRDGFLEFAIATRIITTARHSSRAAANEALADRIRMARERTRAFFGAQYLSYLSHSGHWFCSPLCKSERFDDEWRALGTLSLKIRPPAEGEDWRA
jgi:hypothetical protein